MPNPDRDAMPETNELYERMEADGQDMTGVVPYENVLDRSFVLDIAYQTVQYVLRRSSPYFFITKADFSLSPFPAFYANVLP